MGSSSHLTKAALASPALVEERREKEREEGDEIGRVSNRIEIASDAEEKQPSDSLDPTRVPRVPEGRLRRFH